MNISGVLVPIAVSVVMILLIRTSNRRARKLASGGFQLKLPILYPIMGALCAGGGLAVLGLGLWFSPEEWPLIFISFLLAEALAWPLLGLGLGDRIRVTDKGIEQLRWGKFRQLKWEEVRSARFNTLSMELVVKGGRQVIKVHRHMRGFPQFAQHLSARSGLSLTDMGVIL